MEHSVLFADLPGIGKNRNYLNILLNGSPVSLTFKELFSLRDLSFDSIKLATYVASPSYLNKLKGFKNVRLIVGEEEEGRRALGMNHEAEQEYLKNLDGEILKKVSDSTFEVRTSPIGETVHSKVYVLKNTDTGDIRAMVGSANFTRNATRGKQYEELVVYDSSVNPSFCEFYDKRFDEIWADSIAFFTDISKKKIKLSIVTGNSVTAHTIENSIIFSGNVEAERAENCTIVHLTPEESAQRVIEKIALNAPFQENISGCKAQIEEALSRHVEIQRETTMVNEFLDMATRRQKGKDTIKPKGELAKLKEVIKERLVASSKKSKDAMLNINRPGMTYDTVSDRLYYRIGDETDIGTLYPEALPDEAIGNELAKLSNFIRSYSKFTSRKDSGETEQKVFEAILYSFMAPFIWIIRKDIDIEYGREKLAEVPVFLIIGGQANTGKTRLIRSLSKMTGGAGNYADYKAIESQRHRIISDVLLSENVYPLMVDEVSPRFFRDTGEAVIKSISNTTGGPRPVFIGATNQEFSAESQVIRRVYYLDFRNPIDTGKRKDAEAYFEENVGELTDTLFRHFLSLFQDRRRSGESIYRMEDPLWCGRELFRQLYANNLDSIPEFISDKPMGDYYKEGALLWYSLYKREKSIFCVTKKDGEIYFSIDMAKRYQVSREADKLTKKLPPGIIRSSGPILLLYKEKFLSFIGETEGFMDRLFRTFRR